MGHMGHKQGEAQHQLISCLSDPVGISGWKKWRILGEQQHHQDHIHIHKRMGIHKHMGHMQHRKHQPLARHQQISCHRHRVCIHNRWTESMECSLLASWGRHCRGQGRQPGHLGQPQQRRRQQRQQQPGKIQNEILKLEIYWFYVSYQKLVHFEIFERITTHWSVQSCSDT